MLYCPGDFRARGQRQCSDPRLGLGLGKRVSAIGASDPQLVAQADRDEGRRSDGLTNAERIELSHLRRENKQLGLEREILSKAAAWFARSWPRLGRSGR